MHVAKIFSPVQWTFADGRETGLEDSSLSNGRVNWPCSLRVCTNCQAKMFLSVSWRPSREPPLKQENNLKPQNIMFTIKIIQNEFQKRLLWFSNFRASPSWIIETCHGYPIGHFEVAREKGLLLNCIVGLFLRTLARSKNSSCKKAIYQELSFLEQQNIVAYYFNILPPKFSYRISIFGYTCWLTEVEII